MNKYILAVTRWVVGAATSLHLASLKGAIRAGEARVAKAIRATDLASAVHHAAIAAARAAHDDWADAKMIETSLRNEVRVLADAAKAEADSFRRNHTVGA